LQLEQVSGKPVGKLVNIAGRQRMLSQRVAKFYLAQTWEATVPNAQAELDKARAEFVAALDAWRLEPRRLMRPTFAWPRAPVRRSST
jgi:hypothetical protein